MSDNHEFHPGNPAEGYDRREAKSGLVTLVAAATVITLVAFIAAMYWLTYYLGDRETETALRQPWTQTVELQQREARDLNTYGYLDKQKGVVRIPVERAMELLVEEHQQGRVSYNTKTYAVKVEPPGGAAAPGQAGGPVPSNQSGRQAEGPVPPAPKQ
jgi:anti-sigma-K factor RskA